LDLNFGQVAFEA